jgi:DNA-binding transcriptional LysR family regulator
METSAGPQNLSDLRAFALVADLGSISAAARVLGETKGSVSRRVGRLERSLGVGLLRRSHRRVVPTEDGLLYRSRVARALELLDHAAAEVQDVRAAPRGRLRITAPQDFGTHVLAPHFARFASSCPEVTLEVLLTYRRLEFDADQIDFALRIDGAPADSALVATRLFRIEATLVASPGYLDEHGAPQAPGDLSRHRLLAVHMRGGKAVIPLKAPGGGRAEVVTVTPTVYAQDAAFVRAMALGGVGIALVPRAFIEDDLARGALVRVLPRHDVDVSVHLYLVHPPLTFAPPKARAFRDFMVGALRAPG